jgi:hypothetical protein
MTDIQEIMARAAEQADANPPGDVAKRFGIFLENAFFGLFAVFGWLSGYAWLTVHGIVLAFADGFHHGARTVPKVPPVVPPQQVAPPLYPEDLLENNPIKNAYRTPFGMPTGPASAVYSEPG